MHRSQRFDVVHDGIGLGLFVEAAVAPVLADVVGLALGGEVIALDHLPRGRHQAQGLRKRAHGVDRERARFGRIAELQVTPGNSIIYLMRLPIWATRFQWTNSLKSTNYDIGANKPALTLQYTRNKLI